MSRRVSCVRQRKSHTCLLSAVLSSVRRYSVSIWLMIASRRASVILLLSAQSRRKSGHRTSSFICVDNFCDLQALIPTMQTIATATLTIVLMFMIFSIFNVIDSILLHYQSVRSVLDNTLSSLLLGPAPTCFFRQRQERRPMSTLNCDKGSAIPMSILHLQPMQPTP